MRAWRRGTREMDLILGPFADEGLDRLSDAERARFEALLEENDHDLYRWIAGRIAGPGVPAAEGGDATGPADLQPLLERIAVHAAQRLR
ncbi:MAG: succinate dehydrogenase assembly factor 2 [Pararhodobacter sp.]|nr:succinate dehydrogenase assembly factor 2 [Pararhodobacter sp.]